MVVLESGTEAEVPLVADDSKEDTGNAITPRSVGTENDFGTEKVNS